MKTSKPYDTLTKHYVKHCECPQAWQTVNDARRLSSTRIEYFFTILVNRESGIKFMGFAWEIFLMLFN